MTTATRLISFFDQFFPCSVPIQFILFFHVIHTAAIRLMKFASVFIGDVIDLRRGLCVWRKRIDSTGFSASVGKASTVPYLVSILVSSFLPLIISFFVTFIVTFLVGFLLKRLYR